MSSDREETRKVQQLGSSTLALSLPSEWAAEHGVEKGDMISIRKHPDVLLVAPPSGSPHESDVVVHADALDAEALERVLVSQYVLGRRVISVETEADALSNDLINAVYSAEQRLMGLGIIEETEDRISIRCSINAADFALDNLIERLEKTSRTMREDAIKALVYENPDLAERTTSRERQANKIFVLLLRLVFTAYGNPSAQAALGLQEGRRLVGYRAVVKNLELTADNAEDVASVALERTDLFAELDRATVGDIRSFADQVSDLSALAVRSFVDCDYERTVETRSLYRRLERQQADLLADPPDVSPAALQAVWEVLSRLRTSAQNAMRNAEIATNLALNGDSEFVSVR